MSNKLVARKRNTMQEGKSKLIEAVRNVRAEIYEAVRAELSDETRTYQTIAEENGISVATVQRIAGSLGISRPVGPKPKSSTTEVNNGDN
jgi:DNA invertase Pin-like site-specific DNA recombinase